MKGNSKRTSGNSLSRLGVQNKDLCAASQTVLIRVELSSARRLTFPLSPAFSSIFFPLFLLLPQRKKWYNCPPLQNTRTNKRYPNKIEADLKKQMRKWQQLRANLLYGDWLFFFISGLVSFHFRFESRKKWKLTTDFFFHFSEKIKIRQIFFFSFFYVKKKNENRT